MSGRFSIAAELRFELVITVRGPRAVDFGVPATTRLSTYIYNDRSDIDAAVSGITAAQEFFGVN
jgi:selenocysteine lyase/cysteine desulfurase